MPSVGDRISRESGIVSIPGRCSAPGNQHDSHAEGQNGALSILSHCLAHITAPPDSLRVPNFTRFQRSKTELSCQQEQAHSPIDTVGTRRALCKGAKPSEEADWLPVPAHTSLP